jgi:hypothetical protein
MTECSTSSAYANTGRVDSHFDLHVAAALDQRGVPLGVESFTTTRTDYRPSTPRAENRNVTD